MKGTQAVKGLGPIYPCARPDERPKYPMDTLKRVTNKDGEKYLLFNPVLEHSHLMAVALRSFAERHEERLPLIGPDELLLEYLCHFNGFKEVSRFTGYSVEEINNFFCRDEEAS